MPNRVKNGFRPSASNCELSVPRAILAARAARQARSTWSGCELGAFQNTITASPMNLSIVPPSARRSGRQDDGLACGLRIEKPVGLLRLLELPAVREESLHVHALVRNELGALGLPLLREGP